MDSKARRAQQLDDSYPPIYHTTKLLIKTYGSTKKELIPLTLKVFLNEIKAHIFLSLEGKWQKQWLISSCEEKRNSQS